MRSLLVAIALLLTFLAGPAQAENRSAIDIQLHAAPVRSPATLALSDRRADEGSGGDAPNVAPGIAAACGAGVGLLVATVVLGVLLAPLRHLPV